MWLIWLSSRYLDSMNTYTVTVEENVCISPCGERERERERERENLQILEPHSRFEGFIFNIGYLVAIKQPSVWCHERHRAHTS